MIPDGDYPISTNDPATEGGFRDAFSWKLRLELLYSELDFKCGPGVWSVSSANEACRIDYTKCIKWVSGLVSQWLLE